jgi:subtilase family serine protease
VTAVGGTSLGVASDGNRAIETGWQTRKSTLTNGTWSPVPPAYLYGAGGGTSRLFAQPWYQQGVVPNALASQNQKGKHLGRVVPDVALVGDPNTGMLIGETQIFPDGTYYDQYRIGGTSLSCPLFAGIMALANQRAGGRLGFANPLLYEQYGTRAFNDVVHRSAADIRVDYANGVDAADGRLTSIRTFDFQGLTIKTAPGYDNVTGMGTPNGATFLTAITK